MWPVSCAFTTAEVAETLELPRAALEADRKAGRLQCSYYPDFRETPLKGIHNLIDIVRYDLRHSINVHGPERRLQDYAINALFWMHYCRDGHYAEAMLERNVSWLVAMTTEFSAQCEHDFLLLSDELGNPNFHIFLACSSWIRMFWLFAKRENLIKGKDYLDV